MTRETMLDRAHARMTADREGEAARRAFFAALAAADLVVPLEADVPDGSATFRPLTVETEDGPLVLAFDGADRAAEFLGAATPTATLPGRDLAALLAPAGLGLALNPEVAPSAMLLGQDAMEWVAGIAPGVAERSAGRIAGIAAPVGADPALLDALRARLPGLAQITGRACLARAIHAEGDSGLVLALFDVEEAAHSAAAALVAEALGLAGLPDAALDLVFADAGSDLAQRFLRHGLTLELPPPAAPVGTPGTGAPPKLR